MYGTPKTRLSPQYKFVYVYVACFPQSLLAVLSAAFFAACLACFMTAVTWSGDRSCEGNLLSTVIAAAFAASARRLESCAPVPQFELPYRTFPVF